MGNKRKVFLSLRHILQLEERVLMVLDKEKFTISFNELLQLENFSEKLGKISNLYFINIKEYDTNLLGENLTKEKHKDMLTQYNETLLKSKVRLFPQNATEWGLIDSFIDFNKEDED